MSLSLPRKGGSRVEDEIRKDRRKIDRPNRTTQSAETVSLTPAVTDLGCGAQIEGGGDKISWRSVVPDAGAFFISTTKEEETGTKEEEIGTEGTGPYCKVGTVSKGTGSVGNWSLLPSELAQTIAERLLADVTDYIRFRAVCSSWRSSTEDPCRIRVPPQLPWLMLSFNAAATNARSFFRMYDQKSITFEFDPEIANNRFLGSVDGWLVLVNESSAMHLFEPLTGDLIRLPSLSTLPNILYYDEHEVGNEYKVQYNVDDNGDVDSDFVRDMFVTKVALSSSEYHKGNPIVMVLLPYLRKLVFAEVGDNNWTEIDTCFDYSDILYYQGQFYAVGDYGELMVCDIVGTSAKVIQKTTEMDFETDSWHLAESAGDLLVVARSNKRNSYKRNRCVYELEKFVVFKVENLRDEAKLVQVQSLGEQFFFLGSNQSMSFSASDFPGRIKGNCIYFTGSWFDVCFQTPKPGNEHSILELELFHKGDDFGVFNQVDGNVQSLSCYPDNSQQFVWPPPVWFGLNIRQENDCLRKFFQPKTKPWIKNMFST